MAAETGISKTSVHRYFTVFGLQPHRQDSFKLSTDPFFIEKLRDVVGLCLDPPTNAIVLCVDEKSQCQALERTQPMLPMGLGYVKGVTHDYIRHGTTRLFAALNVLDGEVLKVSPTNDLAMEIRSHSSLPQKVAGLPFPCYTHPSRAAFPPGVSTYGSGAPRTDRTARGNIMAFKKRRDGIYVKDLPPFKKLFPYVMETRTESVIYSTQRVDVTRLLAFLEEYNDQRPKEERVSLFHVLLAVVSRTLYLRPELNRFIVGRRLYQHRDISLTFVAKKEYREDAGESEVRMVFRGTETLEEIRDMVNRRLRVARSDQKGDDDQLMEIVTRLPRPLLNLVVRLIKWLDYHNILPSFLMDAIPLYTSMYLANLGSIGLGAPLHHLFELGTASSFLVFGKIEKQPMVDADDRVVARDCLEFSFTLDERVSEGFNHATSILAFRSLIANPELLARVEISLDAILEAGGGLKVPAPIADR